MQTMQEQTADQGITIGLREIYDTVVETREAVRAYGPRLDTVERVAGKALETASEADRLSKENTRHISLMWKAVGVVASTLLLAVVSAWATHHVF